MNSAIHTNTYPTRIFLIIITTLSIILGSVHGDDPPMSLPGCQERCGEISIPYPFGIGDKCSHNSWFNVTCPKQTSKDNVLPQPYLRYLLWSDLKIVNESFKTKASAKLGTPITGITVGETGPTNTILVADSWDQLSVSGNDLYAYKKLDLRESPYRLMGARNVLLVGGCTGSAVLIRNVRNETLAGCATVCVNSSAAAGSDEIGSCYGLGCCQSAIPDSLDYVEMDFLSLIRQQSWDESFSAPMSSAAVVDISYLANRTVDRELSEFGMAPMLLQWRVEDVSVDSPAYSNSSCVKERDGGYSCTCKRDYFHGNPYLPNGCRAIKECGKCPQDCASLGNNTFRCPPPLSLAPLPLPPSQPQSQVIPQNLLIGLGISLASVFILIILFGFYHFFKRRKEIIFKKENFKKNGGLLLQQQTSASDTSIERSKIFTSYELEKATDNFNMNRVLGRGGQGTVYKGMLVDGTIVAVKKSRKVNEEQLGQFINEVVILSQINHRNVVKMFGCCLETEVPLLVYEYVPNGTLSQHIHSPCEDFHITWKMRLKIATESAEALWYLHSSSFSPIYHRDVKTSNILLDQRYRAKVADFGTSKTLSIDQTHVSTCVQGTFGYIDPEFMQSNQYTEKSDVYSFGIVLLELLTSKKPFYLEKPKNEERKGLALEFLNAIETGNLYDIVDPHVITEATEEEIEQVADLARQCLCLRGRERPTMKQVVMALHMFTSKDMEHNSYQKDIIAREEMPIDQLYSNKASSSTYSSTFTPR